MNQENNSPSASENEYIVNAKLVAIGTQKLHQLVASELEVKDPTPEERKQALEENQVKGDSPLDPNN